MNNYDFSRRRWFLLQTDSPVRRQRSNSRSQSVLVAERVLLALGVDRLDFEHHGSPCAFHEFGHRDLVEGRPFVPEMVRVEVGGNV